jgi:hypothetical protein
MPKRSKPKTSRRSKAPAKQADGKKAPKSTALISEDLWLGCFTTDEPGDIDYAGSFQVIVEASSPKQAVTRLRARLRKIRSETSHFDSPTTIYCDGLVRLVGSFKDGLLVNYVSRPSTENDVQIFCTVPEQPGSKDVDSYGFGEEEGDVEAFLDFGGESFRKALRKAKGNEAGQLTPPIHATQPRRPARTKEEREAERREIEARKSRRAEESAARKMQEERTRRARESRKSALSETLAELGPRE